MGVSALDVGRNFACAFMVRFAFLGAFVIPGEEIIPCRAMAVSPWVPDWEMWS